MPKGKIFCPYESAFFPSTEFRIVDATKVHDVEPLHRATDGVLVELNNHQLDVIEPALGEMPEIVFGCE